MWEITERSVTEENTGDSDMWRNVWGRGTHCTVDNSWMDGMEE